MTQFLEKIKRRYFEVFGDLEKEINFLRKANFSLLGIILFMCMGLILLGMKMPIVIRVSDVKGAEVIHNLPINNEASSPEILGFAKRFTVRYTAFNSYTLTRDLSEAFNCMTTSLQKEAKKSLVESGLVEKLKQASIDTELEFKEVKLERDAKDTSLVTLVGVRRITKYEDPSFHEEMLFRADLALKKVKRSVSSPEGLLVEAYKEVILTKGKE